MIRFIDLSLTGLSFTLWESICKHSKLSRVENFRISTSQSKLQANKFTQKLFKFMIFFWFFIILLQSGWLIASLVKAFYFKTWTCTTWHRSLLTYNFKRTVVEILILSSLFCISHFSSTTLLILQIYFHKTHTHTHSAKVKLSLNFFSFSSFPEKWKKNLLACCVEYFRACCLVRGCRY